MNKLIALLFFVGFWSFAQGSGVKSVTYILEFKPYKNLPSTKELVRTYKCKNQYIYKSYNGFFTDTLLANPDNYNSKKYSTFIDHTIIMKGDSVHFNNILGNDEYTYIEKLNLNWNITDESKYIKGYSCKKAILKYGGRTWETWFTPEIPIDLGPYKFKGLPGLIMSMTDDTGSYDFQFYSFKNRDYFGKNYDCDFKQLFHLKTLNERLAITRIAYNKIESQYLSMTLSEAMNYLNPGKSISLGLRVDNEETTIKDERRDIPNPIEIDHLD